MDRLTVAISFGATIAVIVLGEVRGLLNRPFQNPDLERRARLADTHRRNPYPFD